MRCYSRAADLRAEVGSRFRQAETLSCLGDTHQSAGHREAARDAWLRRWPSSTTCVIPTRAASGSSWPAWTLALAAPSEQART